MNKNEIIFGGLVIGNIVTAIVAIYEAVKLRDISNEFGLATKRIVSDEIDIDEVLVNSAVKKAVEREASYHVDKACEKAAKKIISSFESEIKNAVEDEFKIQRDGVAKEMKRQIGQIDIRDIKREIVAEAKSECAKKLKNDLEEISDKYTDQLDSMTTIYQTIASKIESIGD